METRTSTMKMAMNMAHTAAAAVASATSTMAAMSHQHGGKCKISMVWNWYTIDACFLTRSWGIKTTAQFAGTCVGVVLMVMFLELLRRASKEYDSYIVRKHLASLQTATQTITTNDKSAQTTVTGGGKGADQRFRPSVGQQAVRAGFHTLAFATAYLIMLLAMYYNGYVLLSIVVGAYLGSFVFGWESWKVGDGNELGKEEEVTGCCG